MRIHEKRCQKKKGNFLSQEVKDKISKQLSGKNHPNFGKVNSEEFKLKNMLSQPKRVDIEVIDLETNTTFLYNSIREAANNIECSSGAICYYLNNESKKPFKKRYIIKRIFKD